MSNPTIRQLLTLYDIANTAANHGESVSLDEAKDAMANARTTDLVKQYCECETVIRPGGESTHRLLDGQILDVFFEPPRPRINPVLYDCDI